MRKISLGLILLSLLTCKATYAQIMSNPVQDFVNKTTLLNNILSNKRATDLSQKAQTKGTSTNRNPTNSGRPATGAGVDPTQFNQTNVALLPKLLAERSGDTPEKQRDAERFFNSLLEIYRQTAQKDGFPANDLAYAFEYFVVNSYMTFHDLHDVPYEKDPRVKRGKDMFDRLTIINQKKTLKVTLYQERATYNQLKTLLAGNSLVQKMTGAEKQQLTELLAIMFGANYVAYMNAVNSEDESRIEQARQTARVWLEKLIGVPAERIKIGNEGLQQ
jgi:hypothetical protein